MKKSSSRTGRSKNRRYCLSPVETTSRLSIYKSLTSPTVPLESVMLAVGVTAAGKHEIATVDVTGSYLECPLKDDGLAIVEVSL